MKSITRTMVLILSLFTVFAKAAGPVITGNSSVNSLAVAKKLTAGVSGYRFYASHYVEALNQYESMEVWMNPRGIIYRLSINCQEILEPGETLPGIPFLESGTMKYFDLDLWMLDSDGNEIGQGWFHRDNLVAGDPISVMIRMYSDAKILDLPGAEGYTIHIDGQYAGSWSANYQAYVVWVDETRSLDQSHLYQVRDRNGNLMGGGNLNLNYDANHVVQTTYSTIGIQVEGSTYIDPEIEMGQGVFYIDEQGADLGLPQSNMKTFVVDARNGAWFYAKGDFTEMVVYVNRGGTLYEVGRRTSEGNDNWTNQLLPYETAIVVIYGSPNAEFRARASFNNVSVPRG